MTSDQRLPSRQQRLVILTMSPVIALVAMDTSITGVILPSIARSLHANFVDLEWIVSGYILSYASLLLPSGAFADHFGRRRGVQTGIAIFSLASLLCGLAPSKGWLIAARILQGVGAALLPSSSGALIMHHFRGAERAKAFAIWASVLGLAIAAGPVIGGLIAATIGWRWAFFINVPFGLGLMILIQRLINESTDPEATDFDLSGAILFPVSLGSLVFALIEGGRLGWTHGLVLGAFAGSIVFTTAFIITERKQARPIVDIGLFRKPRFLGAVTAMAGYASAGQILIFFLPLYLQNVTNLTPAVSGFAMLAFAVPLFVAPHVASRFGDRLFGPATLVLGLSVAAAGDLIMALDGIRAFLPVFFAGMALAGSGAGIINGETVRAFADALPPERTGIASGVAATTRFTALLIAIAAFGAGLGGVTTSRFTQKLQADATPSALIQASKRLEGGDIVGALKTLPPAIRPAAQIAAQKSFADGFDVLLFGTAGMAIITGLATQKLLLPAKPPQIKKECTLRT